jgi:HemY protein
MRTVIWLILLFVAAVVAAAALGPNDGVVSIFYGGWRVDTSLNLFLAGVIAFVVVLYLALRGVNALLSLPARAHEWRELKRERAAQAALREALSEYLAARYGRANKAAQRALDLQADVDALRDDHDHAGLAHLIAGMALHRIQDRRGRDDRARRAVDVALQGDSNSVVLDGAHLLMAEWALEDRDAERSLEALKTLAPGVARRTQALRLKLQAARLVHRPMEALQTARLLANHQGFSQLGARSLLRSLAIDVLTHAHDEEQLRRAWTGLDTADRKDPLVAVRAAQCAAALGHAELGRGWLLPHWMDLHKLEADERRAVATALGDCVAGIGSDWLPRVEAMLATQSQEPAVVAAAGMVFAERQLWGKARRPLEQAAHTASLPGKLRRHALRRLAFIARLEGDEQKGGEYEREAAAID